MSGKGSARRPGAIPDGAWEAVFGKKVDEGDVLPPFAGPAVQPCSCPSGDGSLRWPCLVHPPGYASAGDQKPRDCSGDPTSCPDNEGYGCYCSRIALDSDADTATRSRAGGMHGKEEMNAEIAKQSNMDRDEELILKVIAVVERAPLSGRWFAGLSHDLRSVIMAHLNESAP